MNPALRTSAAHVFVASLHDPQPEPDDAHHLFRVLRLRDGEAVTVSDGQGGWRRTHVTGAALQPVGEIEHDDREPRGSVAAAIPKGDRCEWMVQKLTEVGVGEIVLLHCDRSVVRWTGDRAQKQLVRVQRVAREASMQSRRVWLPRIVGPVPFAEVAARAGVALAEPDGDERVAAECVVIGPEGGFSAEELSLGLPRVRLAHTVLRVETAAVVAAVRYLMDP
ncbi:MAG: 16S rRNA (uracil(1498)-N(3))-methyltransferase [Actinobacteria bacterium]|nr:16S rRNA (uracil(1498)-N(3))-methyltransferase [Actinomycetota bacterium]